MSALLEARRIEVRGVVQGVGFRPFVWRLAERHGITGWVRNDGGHVTIHAEGPPRALDAFTTAVEREAPALAQVDAADAVEAPAEGATRFDVLASGDGGGERLVPPDAATCVACLAELSDALDRRFRYPFTNCTHCGPRFTIITSLPYDRERTSMRSFPMCGDCRREYEDPTDRRFHAEPIACPACGPRALLVGSGSDVLQPPIDGDPAAALVAAAGLLRAGAIVAVKGLGGYHLACDATDDDAVRRLRQRKRRPAKPFAVMVADADAATTWFAPTDAELAALASWRAPIVLVADRGGLAPSIAPGHRRHGAMLPSTPLHHLLVREAGVPLVMTSGNASDEPIAIDDDEAFAALGSIADAFVVHDRGIVARYDDSVAVVRTGATAPTVVRRARSSAPHPIQLRDAVRPVLGVGAEMHGAFCLASGRYAYLSQHVGDLDDDRAMRAYDEALRLFRAVFRIEPQAVAHDLHPDLLTTRFAEELWLPAVAVQHHHAHVAATMAEHHLTGDVLGLAFDGLGLGADGTVWGGELLAVSATSARRLARLRPVRQPGGDAATRAPWRMALAHATDAGVECDGSRLLGDVARGEAADVVRSQLATGFASPWTTSAGRLFDAIAALLGICRDGVTYDGQPAVLLEQAAGVRAADLAPFAITDARDGLIELDPRPTVADLVSRATRGDDGAGALAGAFHLALADAAARACARARERTGLDRVVLGGGVFANDLLTTHLIGRLEAVGFRTFVPREVPVGDGGIALGQVLVAAATLDADGEALEGDHDPGQIDAQGGDAPCASAFPAR